MQAHICLTEFYVRIVSFCGSKVRSCGSGVTDKTVSSRGLLVSICGQAVLGSRSIQFYNRITGVKAVDKMIAWMGSRANRIVEKQDKRVVETQEPKKSSMGMREKLVAADRPIMEYRKKRAKLQKE